MSDAYPFSSRKEEKTIAFRSFNAVRTRKSRQGPAKVVGFIAQWRRSSAENENESKPLSKQFYSERYVRCNETSSAPKTYHPPPKFSLIPHKDVIENTWSSSSAQYGLTYSIDLVFLEDGEKCPDG